MATSPTSFSPTSPTPARSSFTPQSPPLFSSGSSTPWRPLPTFSYGIATSAFHPTYYEADDGQEGNPFQQGLAVGDEVYAFEECVSAEGERWYRGYVLLQPPTQDVPLNAFNSPLPSLSSPTHPLSSTSLSAPHTPGTPMSTALTPTQANPTPASPNPSHLRSASVLSHGQSHTHLRSPSQVLPTIHSQTPLLVGGGNSPNPGTHAAGMSTNSFATHRSSGGSGGSSPAGGLNVPAILPPMVERERTVTPHLPEPVIFLGIFPASCVHVSRKVSRYSGPTGKEVGSGNVNGNENGNGARRGGSGEVNLNGDGLPVPKTVDQLAGRERRNVHRRTASRISLSNEMQGVIEYLNRAEKDPSFSLDGLGFGATPSPDGVNGSMGGGQKQPAPIPNLRADWDTAMGETEPLIDHISCALRDWAPRLPGLLREGEYRLFEQVSRVAKSVIAARQRFLGGDMTEAERKELRKEVVKGLKEGNSVLGLGVIMRDEESGRNYVTSMDGEGRKKDLKGTGRDGSVRSNQESVRSNQSGGSSVRREKGRTKWVPPMKLVRMEEAEYLTVAGIASGSPSPALGSPADAGSPGSPSMVSPLSKKFSTIRKKKAEEPSLRAEFKALTASLCSADEWIELFFSVYDSSVKAYITEEWVLRLDHLGMVQDPGAPVNLKSGATDAGLKAKRTVFETIGTSKLGSYLVVKAVKVHPSKTSKDRRERVVTALGVCGLGTLQTEQKTGSERKVELYACSDSSRLVNLHERLISKTLVGEEPLTGAVVLSLQIEPTKSLDRRLRSTSLTRSFQTSDDRDEIYIRLGNVHLPDLRGLDMESSIYGDGESKLQCQIFLQDAEGLAIPHSIITGGNARSRSSVVDAVTASSLKSGYLGDLYKVVHLEPTASLACRIGWHGQALGTALIPLADKSSSYLAEGSHRFNFGEPNTDCYVEARIHVCSAHRIQNKVLSALMRFETLPPAERQEVLKLVTFVDAEVITRHRKACMTALLRIIGNQDFSEDERKAAFNSVMAMVNQFEDIARVLGRQKIPAARIMQSLGDALLTDKRMEAIKALPRVMELYTTGGIAAPSEDFQQLFTQLMEKLIGVIRDGGDNLLAFRVTSLVVFPTKVVATIFPSAAASACFSSFLEAFNRKDDSALVQEARLSLLERIYQESPPIALQLLTEMVRAVKATLQAPIGSRDVVHRKASELLAAAVDCAILEGNQAALEYFAEALLPLLLQLHRAAFIDTADRTQEAIASETLVNGLIATFISSSVEWLEGTSEDSSLGRAMLWASSLDLKAIDERPVLSSLVVNAIIRLCKFAVKEEPIWDPVALRLVLSVLGCRSLKTEAVSCQASTASTSRLDTQAAADLLEVFKKLGSRDIVGGDRPTGAQFRAALEAQQSYQTPAMALLGKQSTLEPLEAEDELLVEVLDMLLNTSRERGVSKVSMFSQIAQSLSGFRNIAGRLSQLLAILDFDSLNPPASWHTVIGLLRAPELPKAWGLCLAILKDQNSEYPINALLTEMEAMRLKGKEDAFVAQALGKAVQLSEYDLANKICADAAARSLSTGEMLRAARMLRRQSELMISSLSKEVPPARFWRTTMTRSEDLDYDPKVEFDLIWCLRDPEGLGTLMTVLMQAYPDADIRPAKGILEASSEITIALEEVTPDKRRGTGLETQNFFTAATQRGQHLERLQIRTADTFPGLLPHSPITSIHIEQVSPEDTAEEVFVMTMSQLRAALWKAELGMEQGVPATKQHGLTTFSQVLDSIIDDEDLVDALKPYLDPAHGSTHPAAARAAELMKLIQHALKLHGQWTANSDLRSFHYTLVQLYTTNFNKAFFQPSPDLRGAEWGPPTVAKPVQQAPAVQPPSPKGYAVPSSPTERGSVSPTPSPLRPRSSLSVALSERLPDIRRRFGSLSKSPRQ